MNKPEIEAAIRRSRVIALMRGFEPETCLRLAEAFAKGGIGVVEVTFDQQHRESWRNTAAAIKAIGERFAGTLAVGAGTVMNAEQLSMMEQSGGAFMVAPNVNAPLLRECVRRGLVAISGAMTPSEAVEGWEAGASFVKIFPANVLGVDYIKAIRAPLGHIPMVAFQGITPDNIGDFIAAGCVGAGVGGKLSNKEWIAAGEWEKITAVASELVEKAKV